MLTGRPVIGQVQSVPGFDGLRRSTTREMALALYPRDSVDMLRAPFARTRVNPRFPLAMPNPDEAKGAGGADATTYCCSPTHRGSVQKVCTLPPSCVTRDEH